MDDLYEALALILINYGEIQALNPIRLASVYHDEKLRITGLVDSTSPRRFVRFVVHLKMSTGQADQERIITDSLLSDLPVISDKEETLVYSAKVEYGDFSGYTLVEYIRQGRWIAYLHYLLEKIHAQAAKERELHQKAIDDSYLFPDFEMPKIHS